jgi:hypothetical protein
MTIDWFGANQQLAAMILLSLSTQTISVTILWENNCRFYDGAVLCDALSAPNQKNAVRKRLQSFIQNDSQVMIVIVVVVVS